MIALREHPEAAAATKNFGFLNISVPREDDLAACAEHLDRLAIPHTPVINGATGRLIGFHDPDRHELSFYASPAPGPAPTRCAAFGTFAPSSRHDERRRAGHRVRRWASTRRPPATSGVAAAGDATRHGPRAGVRRGAGRPARPRHPDPARIRTRPSRPLAAPVVLAGLTSVPTPGPRPFRGLNRRSGAGTARGSRRPCGRPRSGSRRPRGIGRGRSLRAGRRRVPPRCGRGRGSR